MIILFFSQIPEVVYQLRSLTTLLIRFNRIRTVGDGVRNLTVCVLFYGTKASITVNLKSIFIDVNIAALAPVQKIVAMKGFHLTLEILVTKFKSMTKTVLLKLPKFLFECSCVFVLGVL